MSDKETKALWGALQSLRDSGVPQAEVDALAVRFGLVSNATFATVKGDEMDSSLEAPLPKCPHCGAEDSMEHHRVRFPDAPLDADWDECVVCNHKTDPE